MDHQNDEEMRQRYLQNQSRQAGDENQQFYTNQFQPMQHAGFDLHRELNQTATSTENMQFLYDNGGPYLKIYFNENNMGNIPNEYELFDRNQSDSSQHPFALRDGLNNFLPNTQNQLPFQAISHQSSSIPSKNPAMPSNVIHHLVSSLGPNITGTYSPFGETLINNNNSSPLPSFTNSPTQAPPATSLEQMVFNETVDTKRASDESCKQHSPSNTPPASSSNVSGVKKQRIVAEVKPMRMSYSDVLSKNAIIESSPTAPSVGASNSASSSPNTTLPVTTKSTKNDKAKYPIGTNFDKKSQDDPSKVKKSPINSNAAPNSAATDMKKSSKIDKTNGQSQQNTAKKRNARPINSAQSTNTRNQGTKNYNMKNTSDDSEEDDDSALESDEDLEDIPLEFYNVRKNVYQGEHHNIEKIITAKSSYKKMKPAISPTATRKAEKIQKRSTKSTNRKRQKHEVLLKFCVAWAEYMLKFIQWLWTLIYDVGYLSFGIIWDRVSWCYQCLVQIFSSFRQEMRGNPLKAGLLWIKNNWKKWDAKFDKKSKWAFWRWMFKKKQLTSEQTKDYYKDGRLPKTAEEAMKSLLNCKGKDAYSILGVSPNCSQEQIRKHYKKIAVLVHPDKNKQAGAEEAFKVLQRSFELIGEPESRKQYDQSMLEALHAEKAFSELNDLLIQLQAKISEAANTIRCSSCCFRHPRKPTGRKPFAARECSTCKIRHPAREGDIWAETSFFGFRWKYLALMEGNVYDITEWALCQRGALSHLQANSCVVQYKIVLGGNQQQQNQSHDKEKFKKDVPAGEPSMDDFFLNNIYAGQNPQQNQNTRRRYKKN